MTLLPLDRITPGKLCTPLTLQRGTDWLRTFWVRDPIDNTPAIDPTWTYTSRLFDDYGQAQAIPLTVTQLGNGRLSLSLTEAQTAALTSRSYQFDLRAASVGVIGCIMVGRIVVEGRA